VDEVGDELKALLRRGVEHRLDPVELELARRRLHPVPRDPPAQQRRPRPRRQREVLAPALVVAAERILVERPPAREDERVLDADAEAEAQPLMPLRETPSIT
jgi:hypothetical protein